MAEAAELKQARYVVEFGPGTGVVTREIVRRIPQDCRFFAIEINQQLAAETRRRTGAEVIVDSCQHLLHHLQHRGMPHCDAILCTIPWALLSADASAAILDAVVEGLGPEGRFVTVGLSLGKNTAGGKRLRVELEARFAEVTESKKIWANFPPAFYYLCRN
ncbi:MAG: methyltransferase domain-containing protein [Bacteroidota bacterium]